MELFRDDPSGAPGKLGDSQRVYEERVASIHQQIEEEFHRAKTADPIANARLRVRLEGKRDGLVAAAYNARDLRDKDIQRAGRVEPPQPIDEQSAPANDGQPTAHDHESARIRREIAERQEAEYVQCLTCALKAFGPGWVPSHRHFLLEKEEEERVRYTSDRAQAAATVYTVRNAAGEARHFTVEDGKVVEHASYAAGFGTMLLEPHPTRGFEHQGKWCRIHRYSLCFAPYALYEPKTAEQLAALRATRERKKAEREQRKWAEENPLLAWVGLKPDGTEIMGRTDSGQP